MFFFGYVFRHSKPQILSHILLETRKKYIHILLITNEKLCGAVENLLFLLKYQMQIKILNVV
jgi:hypothetical protein